MRAVVLYKGYSHGISAIKLVTLQICAMCTLRYDNKSHQHPRRRQKYNANDF